MDTTHRPSKLLREVSRRKKITDQLVYQYTASWYMYRFLRWCNAKRLARSIFSDRTIAAYLFDKRTGKPRGEINIGKARVKVLLDVDIKTPPRS